MECTFLVCEQKRGAEMNTSISVADELVPSISCRKMEKARPVREEMGGEVVCFPPESAFPL